MRPMTFWALVAATVFLAMTALWAFGEEPTGFVLVASTVLWWGSALTLVFLGLVVIARWRKPAPRHGASPGEGNAGRSREAS